MPEGPPLGGLASHVVECKSYAFLFFSISNMVHFGGGQKEHS